MRSLRRRLLLWLLLGQLLVVAVAGVITYDQVRREVDDLMDSQLRQLARGLALSATLHSPAAADFAPAVTGGNELQVQIFDQQGRRVYSSHAAITLAIPPQHGFSEQLTADDSWRVFALADHNLIILVAQPLSERREARAEVAFASIGPFLALIPLLSLLVWFAVGRALRPLERISAAIGERSPSALAPLPLTDLPSEVAPLVLALNELLQRLGGALASQRRFIADAAHELRTPLAALSLQAQLLGRAHDADERQTALTRVSLAVNRAVHLVQQLLTLARLEPDAMQSPLLPVTPAALARAVIAEQAQLAINSGVDLGLVAGDDRLLVAGDAGSLQILIGNLVANAVRYTPAGGRVDVAVVADGSDLLITVVDNGPGIPVDERERVFDRFYRRLGSGVAGSGLGLAIVREVARRHGGEIRLDDPPDHPGLRATVRLPRLS